MHSSNNLSVFRRSIFTSYIGVLIQEPLDVSKCSSADGSVSPDLLAKTRV